MNADYRMLARTALERARKEIESGDPHRLPYAALELRGAMEAITYSRAEAYKEQLPRDLFRVWQPRKIIDYITALDPNSFIGARLSIGVEDEPGTPAKVMRPLGADTPLTMKDVKAHYDAFGSFLHIPSMDQLDKGKMPDRERLRQRCVECVDVLNNVLKSPIYNVVIGQFTTIACLRCEKEFRWRYEAKSTEPLIARCIECNAEHIITEEGARRLRVEPKDGLVIPCPTEGCARHTVLWQDELHPWTRWHCSGCDKTFGLQFEVKEQSG